MANVEIAKTESLGHADLPGVGVTTCFGITPTVTSPPTSVMLCREIISDPLFG
jgi:hypothetical protein